MFCWENNKHILQLPVYTVELNPCGVTFMKNISIQYYCFGRVFDGIMTVRFTYRGQKIRTLGAGYWRKGKKIYENANN